MAWSLEQEIDLFEVNMNRAGRRKLDKLKKKLSHRAALMKLMGIE